jgi:cytochrome c peroxidase
MLGRRASVAGSRAYHGELVSGDVDDENYQARTRSVFANLIDRVLAPSDTTPEQVVIRYRELFHTAYPNVTLSQLNITHFGNALAAYIAAAFELQPARWDRYVTGDNKALTAEDKHGALLFYGKGRCAVCHAGTQFSDFRFHGLAIPQQRIGKHGAYLDYGRASATSRGADRFAFRTPPLRNVTLTGPWGHNGYFTSLKAIIAHHADPIPELYAAQQRSGTADQSGRLIGFRSPILAEMPPLSTKEIERLVRFLGSLTSQTVMTDEDALPADVPSGNRQFIRR